MLGLNKIKDLIQCEKAAFCRKVSFLGGKKHYKRGYLLYKICNS